MANNIFEFLENCDKKEGKEGKVKKEVKGRERGAEEGGREEGEGRKGKEKHFK